MRVESEVVATSDNEGEGGDLVTLGCTFLDADRMGIPPEPVTNVLAIGVGTVAGVVVVVVVVVVSVVGEVAVNTATSASGSEEGLPVEAATLSSVLTGSSLFRLGARVREGLLPFAKTQLGSCFCVTGVNLISQSGGLCKLTLDRNAVRAGIKFSFATPSLYFRPMKKAQD